MSSKHFRVSPSKSYQWVPCPGSVRMQEDLPEPEKNVPAIEGDETHELGADLINLALRGLLPGVPQSIDSPLNIDQKTAALYYAEIVESICRGASVFGGEFMGVEDKLDLSCIYPGMFGTADFWLYDKQTRTVHIVDLKYGFRPVSAYRNTQLVCYAAGVLDKLMKYQVTTVSFLIVQPRVHPYTSGWTAPLSEVRPIIDRIRTQALYASGNVDSPIIAGKHCYGCEAQFGCPAFGQRCEEGLIYAEQSQAVLKRPGTKNLATQYAIFKEAHEALGLRLAALEKQLEGRLRKGEAVPGWHLHTSKGKLDWTVDAETVAMVMDSMGVESRKPLAVRTPTQLMKEGVDETIINEIAERKKGTTKLKEDNLEIARKVFPDA